MSPLKEIVIKEGHSLRHVGAPDEQVRFVLQAHASLDYFLPVLDDAASSTHVVVELQGDHSQVNSKVLYFGSKKQEQKLRIEHLHEGRQTHSHLVAKGAVKDNAVSQFYGLIKMLPGSQGAEGSLNEHSLLLSSGAKIEAVPALEVEHDDVQASHAATLEKVDNEKLFYLLSRGLTEASAMELLVEGFFKDALDELPVEVREDYYAAILKKL
jgi:Fe-S cluster assembly scaffold protein SufB